MSNNVTSISNQQPSKLAEAATVRADADEALELSKAEEAAARDESETQPTINYETFNKEQAQRLFDNRRKNRQLRNAGVVRYAKIMNDGQWRTHDRAQSPLLIDEKGKLAGGQHRIAAFIKSKLQGITFPVARNASEEEIRNQDAGINRTFNDYVAMFHSLPKFNNITEAKLNAVGKILLAQPNPSAMQVAEMIIDAQPVLQLIDDVIHKAGMVQRYAPLLAAFVLAHRAMTASVWKDALINFDSGTNEKESPMALLSKSLDTRRQNELFCKALHALKATEDEDDIRELTADEAHLKWCEDKGVEDKEGAA